MSALGTLVVEEFAMPVVGVKLRDGQIHVDAGYSGPHPGLPLEERVYGVFDPDGRLVFRGRLEIDLEPVEDGGYGQLSIDLRVESSPGTADGRAHSLQSPHAAVDDERRLIDDAVFPASAVFLGWREPDGGITDTPSSLALPRLYQIG